MVNESVSQMMRNDHFARQAGAMAGGQKPFLKEKKKGQKIPANHHQDQGRLSIVLPRFVCNAMHVSLDGREFFFLVVTILSFFFLLFFRFLIWDFQEG
jgi:hypothetical protein